MTDRRAVLPAEGSEPDPVAALNHRDVEVLGYLADGRSTSQIAGQLAVSTNTARTRIRRVQARLAVTDRAAAVRTAQELGVVAVPRPRRPAD
jgi:ATP/maltotriose-dependent transcriptional regulator MalT